MPHSRGLLAEKRYDLVLGYVETVADARHLLAQLEPLFLLHFEEGLLSDEAVEALARFNYAKHCHGMDFPEVWDEETEGHRNLWLNGAREQLRAALATFNKGEMSDD
jgi:hypothetical protein